MNIDDLRKPSQARQGAQEKLDDAHREQAKALKKLETARAKCAAEPSPENFKKRANAEQELEPHTEFIAHLQREYDATLGPERAEKSRHLEAIERERLQVFQVELAPGLARVAELHAAIEHELAALYALGDKFDRDEAELAKVARTFGASLLQRPSLFRSNLGKDSLVAGRDFVHASLPASSLVFGMPETALPIVNQWINLGTVRTLVDSSKAALATARAFLSRPPQAEDVLQRFRGRKAAPQPAPLPAAQSRFNSYI